MTYLLWIVIGIVVLFMAFNLAWRAASRRWQLPCPSLLSWAVEGPVANWFAGTTRTLEALRLEPGQTILEVGPGPGRLLVPASFRVLPGGRAIGVDLQPKMIEKLNARAARAGVTNLTTLVGDATDLKLPGESVDLAFLCTVLGEIPDRGRALAECYRVLKPGGKLSITEIIGDPHYQRRATVQRLAEQAGFQLKLIEGGWRMFTATFEKPG